MGMHPEWEKRLSREFDKPYFSRITEKLKSNNVYPPRHQLFRCFDYVSPSETKVVVLGQDPYHGEGQANGLAFSVNPGVRLPPSLVNVFKEIKNCYPDYAAPKDGDLTRWAEQGVLLLNTTLSVERGRPMSHQGAGWELFTNEVMRCLRETEHVVYLLWGAHARSKTALIDGRRNLVLTSGHPSPLSVSRFLNKGHFRLANEYLKEKGRGEIVW